SEVRLVRVSAGAHPCYPLVDSGRRVRHRANDRYALRKPRLDRARRDCRGYRQDRLRRRDRRRDLVEEDVEVLRLARDPARGRTGPAIQVETRPLAAEPLAQFLDALLAPRGRDDLDRCPPAAAEQARDQRLADRACAKDGYASLIYGHWWSLG